MNKKFQRIICGTLALVMCSSLIVGITGCGKKEEEIIYELTPVTADDLEAGNFYVKNGDSFFKLPSGTRTYSDKELIAKEASTDRMILFGQDDVFIPTLYKDDQLIYCTDNTIPNAFVWERYYDNGYTLGISHLYSNDANRYASEKINVKADSSISLALTDISDEETVIIDKIDAKTVNNTMISDAGTITGLSAGKSYKVDAYVGTKYIEANVTADTHAFSSYELYETSNYSFDQSNFIILNIPNYFRSGFYYINGTGMVRYANVTREEGVSAVNFNSPYYLGFDENGNIITADDENVTKDDENVSVDGNIFTHKILVDCTNEKMYVKINYSDLLTEINGIEINTSDAILESLNSSSLDINMYGPDGTKYVFTPSNTEENTVECTVDMPLSGEWEVVLKGFDLRTFSITTEFTSGHSDTMIHTGSGKATMVYYLKDSMSNSIFNIEWSNKDRAATVTIIGPDKTEYNKENDESCILESGYGFTKIKIDDAKYGNYTIEVEGEELGRVRTTVEQGEPETVEDVSETDTTDTAE